MDGSGKTVFQRLRVPRSEEFDLSEKMLPDARDPGLGHKVATLERVSFIAWKVDGVIQQFCWKAWVLTSRLLPKGERLFGAGIEILPHLPMMINRPPAQLLTSNPDPHR